MCAEEKQVTPSTETENDIPTAEKLSHDAKIAAIHESLLKTAAEETAKTPPENEKIAAIHASLLAQAIKEDDAETSHHVAERIQTVKAKRDFPEKNTEKPPESKQPAQPKRAKTKKSFWRRVRGIFPEVHDSVGEMIRKCLLLIAIVVFLVCMVWLGSYLMDLHRSTKLYDSVGITYHARTPERVEDEDNPTEMDDELTLETSNTYSLLPGADELLAMNDEIVGWISIPSTRVDYPVLQHLEDTEEDNFYLYRNVQKEDARAGSIYLDYRCSFDRVGEDGTLAIENSDNLIIYGHNMANSSMFGTLKYYVSDEDYYEEHPVIELNSNYETYQYKIIGYFIADAEDQTETRFDYWNAINFEDEAAFYDYVNEVKRRTIRITNVDVEYGDQLLTLATCHNSFDTARLVIVARRVRDGEDAYDRVKGTVENPNVKMPTAYYRNHTNTYDPDAAFAPYG